MRFELCALTVILVLLNLPLLRGSCALEMVFLPGPVAAGEWWRVLTHPFVHVSWYHLLLDATAFLLLYQELREKKWVVRLGCVLACGAGSLLVSMWAAPMIEVQGLCGLSGIAHGLMAISALDMIRTGSHAPSRRAQDPCMKERGRLVRVVWWDGFARTRRPRSSAERHGLALRRAGFISFALVVTKCVIEAVTGGILFERLHPGSLGVPVAVCHAGGVLGGLVGWILAERLGRIFKPRFIPSQVIHAWE